MKSPHFSYIPPEALSPTGLAKRRGPICQTVELSSGGMAQHLLNDMFEQSLVLLEDWQRLSEGVQGEIGYCRSLDQLLPMLVEHQLLTKHQAERIRAGTTYGLVLGNYRVLDRIGAGGMGVVFKAEHILMRRHVAIKVLPLSRDQDPRLLLRFIAEMRAVAALQHPNIVAAMDAGQLTPNEPNNPVLHYLVMEYVPGQDLEDLVYDNGPMEPIRACDVIHQISCALAEANQHQMVHRDIKPSNILVTSEDHAKLLDFGLAHDFRSQLTEAGSLLGTLEYMAPEQAQDARMVDIRADIYGLGGTLFWCLTGQMPFPRRGLVMEELTRRVSEPPPSVRKHRPELPQELDAVVARMLAPRPADRFPTPQHVMRALMPFLKGDRHDAVIATSPVIDIATVQSVFRQNTTQAAVSRILLIDDDSTMRQICKFALQNEQMSCDEAVDGLDGWQKVQQQSYDLVLVDMDMPRMTGPEVLQKIREIHRYRNVRIIMMSGRFSTDEMAQTLAAGADDFLTKPFSIMQLRARATTSLRLKTALDQSDALTLHLQTASQELERALTNRDHDLVQVRNALVLGLASVVEHRTTETAGHLMRIQKYSRSLAEDAARMANFPEIDLPFLQNLECCAPLHDIGIVALPDHILLKPGKLEPDERVIMQAHTLIGAQILEKVLQRYGSSVKFLQMGIDLARGHHEHFSGGGYPDKIQGTDIPLCARILAIGDVYDALRSRRSYRPALSHNAAVQVIREASPGQFDPDLLTVFAKSNANFDKIYTTTLD